MIRSCSFQKVLKEKHLQLNTQVELKNSAHFARYVRGIFADEVNERKIMRALKVEHVYCDCLEQHKGGTLSCLLQCHFE